MQFFLFFGMFATFTPLLCWATYFHHLTRFFQRLWFSSGLGVIDTISLMFGLGVLIKMNQGGYRADVRTVTRKNYGKWWFALLASILAIPFVVASSVMPLCLQTDLISSLPNYLPWVVVVTKSIQCLTPAFVWIAAPTCRFQRSS